MNYPLNMTKPGEVVGYAVANDEAEHASLSGIGYEPKLETPSADDLTAKAEALGIKIDKRWSPDTLAAKIAETEAAQT